MLKAVAEDFDIRAQKIPIGLSIGAAVYPSDGTDLEMLIANADAALYRAKADGRQTVRFFDPEMDKRLRERYALQHDLRSAMSHGELTLHYQPQAKIHGEVLASKRCCAGSTQSTGLCHPGPLSPSPSKTA